MAEYTTVKVNGLDAAPGSLADADLIPIGAGSDGNLYTRAASALKAYVLNALVTGVSSVFGRTGAVVQVAGDYTATQVTNTPAGNIAATNVQAAINELDTEKAALAGAAFTGSVTVAGASLSVSGGDLGAARDGSRAVLSLNTYYDITSGSSRFIQRRARGTESVPSAVLTNDYIGNILIQGYGASAFVTGAEWRVRAIAATPSNTDMEADFYFAACAAASASPTPVFVFGHTNGIQFGGVSSANTILDANRLLIARSFTVATLPVAPLDGAIAKVTDATAPVKGTALVGGGAVSTIALYSGGAWLAG